MLMNVTCYLQSTQEEQALSLHPRNCFLPAGFNILPTFLFVAKYALLFLVFSHLQLLWFSLLYSKFYQLISANCSVRNWTQHFVFGACKISFEVFALSIFQKFLYFLQSPLPQQIQPLPSPQSSWHPTLSYAGQQLNTFFPPFPRRNKPSKTASSSGLKPSSKPLSYNLLALIPYTTYIKWYITHILTIIATFSS